MRVQGFAYVPAAPGDSHFPSPGEDPRPEPPRPPPPARGQAAPLSKPLPAEGDLGLARRSIGDDLVHDPAERQAYNVFCGVEQVSCASRSPLAGASREYFAQSLPFELGIPDPQDLPIFPSGSGGDKAALSQNGLPPPLPGPMAALVERRVSKTEEQISLGVKELTSCSERVQELEQRVAALEKVLKLEEEGSGNPGRKKKKNKARRDSGSSAERSIAATESAAASERIVADMNAPLVQNQVHHSAAYSTPEQRSSVLPVPMRMGTSPLQAQGSLASMSKQHSFASSSPKYDREKEVPRTSVSMYDFLVDSVVEAETRTQRLAMGAFLTVFMCWHWSLAFAFFDGAFLQLYIRKRIWLDKFPAGGFYDMVLPAALVGDIGSSQPVTLLACGISSVLVLAAVLAHDTHKAFYKFRPPRSIPDSLEFALSLAWLLRSAMLPCYVSVGAIGAVIGCQTPFEMMGHTMTAIFLLFLDDLAYRCLLDDGQREVYERGHRTSSRLYHSSLQQQGYLNVYLQANLAQWIGRLLIANEALMLSLYFVHARLYPDAETGRMLWAGLMGARIIGMEICHALTTRFQVHPQSRFFSAEPKLKRLLVVCLHVIIAVLLTVVVLPLFGFRASGAENDCALRCLSDMQERSNSCEALFPGWPSPHTSFVC